MTKILVPVDFSEVSVNAVEYAIQMAGQMPKAEVVLFHAVSPGGIGADGSPIELNDESNKSEAQIMLESMQVQLFEKAPVPTDFILLKGEFHHELQAALLREKFDFVVMGISGGTTFEERFGSSNVLKVIDKNQVPIIIVSETMHYRPLKKLALTVELENVDSTIPATKITELVSLLGLQLHVLYANANENLQLTDAQHKEWNKLQNMFASFNPAFHNLHMHHFVDAINTFVYQNDIDMLVVIPRKHNYLDKIISGSHTKQLAFHSVAPVLAVHA